VAGRAERFAVYRNNVATSLVSAMETAFPTVRRLVGDEFFAAMALAFVRAHPPTSPLLMFYGAAFPGFLARFPPVARLGYLPDIARLDQAMRESYHAADSRPMSEAEFARLLASDVEAARLRLAPSLRIIRSDWPIHAIWRATMEGGPHPAARPEDVVILRPDYDPLPQLLPMGGATFISGLLAGETIGQSLATAGESADLVAILGVLIPGRAILGVLT
ncbi:MAG: DUF2063 domain-containing protein, partial [Tabrizicola sp.]|nr:DUF2063 domain-containing protein [Tabrizicola sp.]